VSRHRDSLEPLLASLRRSAAALYGAEVPFLLGGGLACWARGGPVTDHDVDLFVRPAHAEQAASALEGAGMTIERPPESWLLKAYDDGTLVDLIYEPAGGPVDDAMFGRAEDLEVMAVPMKVAAVDDVLVTKLLALSEQEPDYGAVLAIARTLREQVDWDSVRDRTSASPFARAFFTLAEGLRLIQNGAR
jgi:Nucleotidyl transferase of unknown function (DUF2204)